MAEFAAVKQVQSSVSSPQLKSLPFYEICVNPAETVS